MSKKKRLKKRQIKEDSFVTYSLKASDFARNHFNQIIIGIVVIAIVVGFFLFTSYARQNAALEADRMFGSALELYRQNDIEGAKKAFTEIADQYSRVQAGVIALYFKGECNLKLSSYSEALSSFEAYIRKSSKFPLFKEAAVIGKALALEKTGNYGDAALVLEGLLKDMDEADPRYLDVVYRTAIFYSKISGFQFKAKEHFKTVSEKAAGRIKKQAKVALVILEEPE